MKMATSQISNISHWLPRSQNARIGLAITVPAVAILLCTTPVTSTLFRAWKRIVGKAPSKETTSITPSQDDRESDGIPPKLPAKTYKLSTAASIAAFEPQEPPQLPSKAFEPTASTATFEPVEPRTPDAVSISSDASSERAHKQRKLRLGKNIKKAWQNRRFGHAPEEGAEKE